jgi:predicted transcriptional regulator
VRDVEERAEAVPAGLPSYVWDGERLPVPVEDIADIEEEASAFAAPLLMPQWLFVREHARRGGDVAALGAAFGTSVAATERRISTLFA